MKSGLLIFTVTALATGSFVSAADAPAPPPPPAADSSAKPRAEGKAGLAAAAAHHPMLGLMKEIETKGKITKEEFLAHSKKQAEEMFSKLDKNNDGVIDKSEVAELESRMKGAREKMQEGGKAGSLSDKMKKRGKGDGDGTRKRPAADEKTDPAKPAA